MRPAEHLQENDSVAFDEAHQRIAVVWPEVPEEIDVPDLQAERAALLRGLLMWLVEDSVDARSVGRKAILLSYVLNPNGTQSDLAKRLQMSKGRVSQILSELRTKLNFRA